jgi:hypothetical protein
MTTQGRIKNPEQEQLKTATSKDPRWEPPADWRTELVFARLDKALDLVTPFPGEHHDSGVRDALVVTLYQIVLELDIVRRELAWARQSRGEASP